MGELESICEGVFLLRELSPAYARPHRQFRRASFHAKSSPPNSIRWQIENVWKDSRELIRTDSNFNFAAVDFAETNEQIKELFSKFKCPELHILPGFIASDANDITTTLGRGGSDYTAAILAAALDAGVLEIWTDVSGMMTADPRIVRNIRQIPHITYREAMELSHFGAKVIYPPTIQPVMAKRIPVWIKNTFAPDDFGTLIEAEIADETEIIRGISSIDKISVLNLEGSGMVGIPGFSKRLFDALSRAQINVILITQSSSEHSICVAVEEKFGALAKRVVDREFEYEIAVGKIEPLRVENGFSILALVGDNMKNHTGHFRKNVRRARRAGHQHSRHRARLVRTQYFGDYQLQRRAQSRQHSARRIFLGRQKTNQSVHRRRRARSAAACSTSSGSSRNICRKKCV